MKTENPNHFNPAHLEVVTCDKCKNNTFKLVTMLYKLPKLASPSGSDEYIPTDVWVCDSCGHANEDIPDSLSNAIKNKGKVND